MRFFGRVISSPNWGFTSNKVCYLEMIMKSFVPVSIWRGWRTTAFCYLLFDKVTVKIKQLVLNAFIPERWLQIDFNHHSKY